MTPIERLITLTVGRCKPGPKVDKITQALRELSTVEVGYWLAKIQTAKRPARVAAVLRMLVS